MKNWLTKLFSKLSPYGVVKPVFNKERKIGSSLEYKALTVVNDGVAERLLITDNEYKVMRNRADNNPEDFDSCSDCLSDNVDIPTGISF
jgi:hypothetical protein